MKLLVVVLFPMTLLSQIQIGTNAYVEYHPGTLPIVISVPHDGSLTPDNIPDRTCLNPTTVTDYNTYKLAKYMDSSLFEITNCHPHLVFCNLKRTKLDCNRDLEEAACGNPDAEIAWNEYHDFIRFADSVARQNNRVFYIDVHGHGHDLQQIELGYLYDSDDLNQTDQILNSQLYIEKSSIQNLALQNELNLSNAELIRGELAFGTLLTNASYPAVPSMQFPSPGSNPYFTGGYSTQVHTSYLPGIETNGVQMEFNFDIRQSNQSMKVFSNSLALILVQFLNLHTSQDITSCSNLSLETEIKEDENQIYPNPASDFISFDSTKYTRFELFDLSGKMLKSGPLKDQIDIRDLQNGSYFIKCFTDSELVFKKILIKN